MKFSGSAFISSDTLKLIALVSMFLDHTAAGILCFFCDASSSSVYIILRNIGRLSFPLYAFLLVEGYIHTHSRLRYARNLILFAVISEVPFDFLFHEGLYAGHQNVYFTLFLGLLTISAAGWIDGKNWPGRLALELYAAIIISFIAEIIHADYGMWGVLLIFIIFLARNRPPFFTAISGSLFMLLYPGEIHGIASFILIFFYNGTRKNSKCKYVFYFLYPLHLLLMFLIRMMLYSFF